MKAERDRLAPAVKAYRWWVSWDISAVVVTAATAEEATALVKGMGYFGPPHVYQPKVRVVRATQRHLELFDPAYNSACLERQRRLEGHPGHQWAAAEVEAAMTQQATLGDL